MKIKIHKNDLLNILNVIETGLTSNNVIQSLKGINIEVNENQISFLTSKSEMAIKYVVSKDDLDVEIQTTGSLIVPGFNFINIIKKLDSTYINLEHQQNILDIKTNSSHVELICLDKKTYPSIKFELENSQEINMNKNILIDSYNKTKYSIDTNPINQILSGINFKFDDKLKVSSTDSLRMTLVKQNITSSNEINFTINKSTLKDLIKTLNFQDEDNLKFNISNNQLLVKCKNIQIKLRLLDGNYPDIERIIPTNSNFAYETSKEKIMESLSRVSLLTEKNESIVICTVENNQLHLKTSHKYLGKMEDICQIKSLKGTPFTIAFDPHFVIEALLTLNEEVIFEFVDEVSGFVIKNKDDDSIINVISPIRVS